MPLPGLLPKVEWTPPNLGELPSWEGAKRVSFDVETYDPDLKKLGIGCRREGYIVGYSFAIEDGPGYYIPIRHQGGDNVDAKAALRYLRDQAKFYSGELVAGNAPYDLDYAAEEGVEFNQVRSILDVQIAEPLINEYRRQYNLDSLAANYDLESKKEAVLNQAADLFGVDSKSGLWRLPGRYVAEYGEYDAHLPLKILRKQERTIEDEDLWDIWRLECKVQPVLLKMRRRGIRIHFDRLEYISKWSIRREQDCLDEIHRLSGHRLEIADTTRDAAIAPVIESLGFTLPKTATGKKSIRSAVLDTIDHPVAELVRRAKAYNKLRNTFVDSIYRYQVKGRIHTTLNQLRAEKDDGELSGTVTGRLSCTHPNLQQQPVRNEEFGYAWRGIYLPEEGSEWGSSDYSQQEPRMVVHYAELCNLPGSHLAGDRYRQDPKADNHTMMADLTGLPRSQAKIIFLALCYRMGGAKLCRQLGLGTRIAEIKGRKVEVAGDEGQAILDQFDAAVPFVRALGRMCERKAERAGHLRTLLGRKCRFPTDALGNFQETHKALNKLIQGSSADQTKAALVAADEAGLFLQLQIHDEIAASLRTPKEGQLLAEVMTNVVKLRVPSRVDLEVGPSWGESAPAGAVQCKEFYAA